MRYGLIGEKLSHSFSPFIHNALGNLDYSLVEITEDQLQPFLERADFAAINVTIPYKKKAAEFCDFLSPEAQKIGCVNTIINRDGILWGYNTDYFGFTYLINCLSLDLIGKKVIVLGSGGTSQTVVAVCEDLGAKETVIVSRNGMNNYQNLYNHYDAQVLINTTPIGMSPLFGESPVDIEPFHSLHVVIEVIYNPLRSALVLQAKGRGIAYASGLNMLVAQAKASQELFFGTRVDDELIEKISSEIEEKLSNVVLIGMPGCGKTTVGKELACQMKMSFCDIDQTIERETQKSVEKIFSEDGEKVFRDWENRIIKQVCQKSGQVIATGGGSILNEENASVLAQNGFVVWMKKEINELSLAGRPLSQSRENLIRMSNERSPLYRRWCDIQIDATGKKPDEISRQIIKQRHSITLCLQKTAPA